MPELHAQPSNAVRLALTVTEAAAALGVSDDYFRDHIAAELRMVRRGRKKLIAVASSGGSSGRRQGCWNEPARRAARHARLPAARVAPAV